MKQAAAVLWIALALLIGRCCGDQTVTDTTAKPYQSSPPRQAPVAHEINALAATYIAGLRLRENQDFGELYLYHNLDRQLMQSPAPPGRVVFLGDSITDLWEFPRFFPGKPYVNRGIAGQVTAQMLLRFQQDVVALKPRAVVLLSGTNDIAGMLQLPTPEAVEDNWRSMAELAEAHGITPVFCSILPTHSYTQRAVNSVKEHSPAETQELNAWLERYTQQHGLPFIDYRPAMTDKEGHLRREFSEDGIHPTAAGYAAMAAVLEPVLDHLRMRTPRHAIGASTPSMTALGKGPCFSFARSAR